MLVFFPMFWPYSCFAWCQVVDLRLLPSVHGVMMNHKLLLKGQTATYNTLAFIGQLWYATVILRDTSCRKWSRFLFFFLYPCKTLQEFLSLNCGRRKFECQVSYVEAKASWWVCKPHHLSLTAAHSVPPSGPQLKTIKISRNSHFTIPPQSEGK